MPSIKLSDIQDAADAKYGNFEVHLPDGDIATFSPALRLPKERRAALSAALDLEARSQANNGDDLYDVYKDIFRISATTAYHFTRLEACVGDDPAVWEQLVNEFIADTQTGEALPSVS